MANVHGIGDNNDDEENQMNNAGGGGFGNYFNPGDFINNNQNNQNRETTVGVEAMRAYLYKNNEANPRNETFCPFLKITMCPVFSFKSFTFFIIFVNSVIYLITLCFGLENTNTLFLSPKRKTLEKFGSLGYKLIMRSPLNLVRLISNSFLHLSFSHILSNIITAFIFATLIEKIFQFWKYFLIYIMSGLLGSICYVMMSKDSNSETVGASISIFGVFGSYFAYWIINYTTLSRLLSPTEKCCMLNLILFMMLFLLLMQLFQSFDSDDNVNILGHFAGMIYGFFLAFIISPPDYPNTTACIKFEYWRIISIIICASTLIGGIIFLAINYSKQ
ncbi:MAG: rhomboid family intramembrane serine protease [archaeon]|nr:rhomboid family intramembrane serine protease [archaeon]